MVRLKYRHRPVLKLIPAMNFRRYRGNGQGQSEHQLRRGSQIPACGHVARRHRHQKDTNDREEYL